NKLGEDGLYNQCGWLDDKFGGSWQIIPGILGKLMADPEKGDRVVKAFMQMKKFDIATLQNA
ncbi:MAG: VOC family protein, partial [Paludibacter sp.]|nr:VOC family protein [Paludibacter sp.]